MSDSKYLSITKWAEEDRPREKLLEKGASSLTTAELIAILLGSGNINESAVDLAKRIFKHSNNELSVLFNTSINELKKFKGVGTAKAVTIAAAIELARRYNASKEGAPPDVIETSSDAYCVIAPNLLGIAHEEFWIICLTRSNTVISKHKIAQGGFTASYVDIKLVFQKALADSASSIIICHNHPSGSILISQNDKILTNRIKNASEILDIRLFDHIIVAGSSYISFSDENIL